MSASHDTGALAEPTRLSILVGVPDAAERQRICALLRAQGHSVIEAADTREMGARLDELAGGGGPDAIVCSGLLAHQDDPALAARLASPAAARALVLLPSDGMLATASRAQRLGASAVLPDVPALGKLRRLLASAVTP